MRVQGRTAGGRGSGRRGCGRGALRWLLPLVVAAAAGRAPAGAMDENSLRLTRPSPGWASLVWVGQEPSAYCVQRGLRPTDLARIGSAPSPRFTDELAGADLLFYSVLESLGGPCAGECVADAGCPPLLYCHRSFGACGGAGACALRPGSCASGPDPVCGCDGVTYASPCEAAAAGASVAAAGACAAACQSNLDCNFPSEYCRHPAGGCQEPGECVPKGDVCPAVWIPVCGCDGQTYSNAACAGIAGVSVAHDGPC